MLSFRFGAQRPRNWSVPLCRRTQPSGWKPVAASPVSESLGEGAEHVVEPFRHRLFVEGARARVQSTEGVRGISPMHAVALPKRTDRVCAVVEALPRVSQLGSGFTRPAPALRLEEFNHVERLLAFEHVVDGGGDLPGEDPEGLSLAVPGLKLLEGLLGGPVSPQKQTGRLREGPLQVGVPDLLSAGAQLFPRRFLGAPDEPTVGDEILHPGKSGDVVDLVEENQPEDLPHSGDGPKQVVAVGIVDPGMAGQVELDLLEVLVVDLDQGQVSLDALSDAVIGKALGEIFPVGRITEASVEFGQVVLGVGVLDVGQKLGALAHEEVATS